MSAAHMGLVFAADGLDGSEKLLLLGLTNYTDPHGYCWPSEARLADECGTSRSTVQRVKRKLAARGLVKSVRRVNPKTGEPISNLTRVNLRMLESMSRGGKAYDDDIVDALTFESASDLLKGHSDSGLQSDPGYESDWSRPRVKMTPTLSQNDSQSLIDPVENPSSRVPKPRPAAPPVKTEEEGSTATPEQQRARLFLMRLPAPWALGPADAAKVAPVLAAAVDRLGLDYDDRLAAQIAHNDFGINNFASVIETKRIPNLRPAAPKPTALPPACPACLDANPAAALNKRFRTHSGLPAGRRCTTCHPDTAQAAA